MLNYFVNVITPQELPALCCKINIKNSDEFDVDLCEMFLNFNLVQGQTAL